MIAPHERVPVEVFARPADASRRVTHEIADLIRTRQAAGQRCVLGLATGSTPTGVYAELVRLHREEKLSFQNVTTFNLDEYYPMQPGELQSYRRFMREHLFDLVDIRPEQTNVPDGTVSAADVERFGKQYEEAIAKAGGIDLQLLGIGRTGHIGFNEPGSPPDSRTRLISLDRLTRMDAAGDFFGEEHVPRRAITMGVGTIMEARRVILLSFGEGKSAIVRRAVEDQVDPMVSASFLQRHANVTFVLDEASAAALNRQAAPWLRGPVKWDNINIRKAVVWLARQVNKPILLLSEEDYNEHGLRDLLATQRENGTIRQAHGGPSYQINLDVFRELQATITGWPGGKPASSRRPGDIVRPRDAIFPKRIVVFSPHPDDDVISMGGTVARLADHGHEVHVAYQTSGNIAVFDHDVVRYIDFARGFAAAIGLESSQVKTFDTQAKRFLAEKRPGQIDPPSIQAIKTLIRRGEATAASHQCGIPAVRLHFMDLPFYETGAVKKKPLGEEDIRLTLALLQNLKPQQIYAAGDLSDPHGTHRVCLAAVMAAARRLKEEAWFATCEIWLYRGAWQEWEPERIEMAVPLSPEEVRRKREAIFRHQSQKDRAMFPGADEREFWERAEARNRATADLYDSLGLSHYAAIEGFVRWTVDDTLGAA